MRTEWKTIRDENWRQYRYYHGYIFYLFSSLRLSSHKLQIEKGRYIGQNPDLLCKCGVEDETHFFMQCQKFETTRTKCIASVENISANKYYYYIIFMVLHNSVVV
jgi:hypothetical protein